MKYPCKCSRDVRARCSRVWVSPVAFFLHFGPTGCSEGFTRTSMALDLHIICAAQLCGCVRAGCTFLADMVVVIHRHSHMTAGGATKACSDAYRLKTEIVLSFCLFDSQMPRVSAFGYVPIPPDHAILAVILPQFGYTARGHLLAVTLVWQPRIVCASCDILHVHMLCARACACACVCLMLVWQLVGAAWQPNGPTLGNAWLPQRAYSRKCESLSFVDHLWKTFQDYNLSSPAKTSSHVNEHL